MRKKEYQMKPSLRFAVFQRDEFTCQYCGKKSPEAILEVDHMHPESQGGVTELENLITSCFECNRGKGVRLLSSVPVEFDVHEKAIAIVERERQIHELNFWRAKQRQREEKEIAQLATYWDQHAWRYGYESSSFRSGNIQTFLQHFCCEELLAFLKIALSRDDLKESRQWRYFCGIVWNRIKEANADGPD
jgi:hypothetical protein